MSVDTPQRTNTIWDIKFDKQISDAKLIAFDQHKKALLDHLRKKRIGKSQPFDVDQSWRVLRHLAELYFWEAKIKPQKRPDSDHAERLRDLAKALGRARRKTEKAMQGDVGRDLFGACFARPNKPRTSVFSLNWVPPDDDGESFDWGDLADTIKTVLAGLATLETAAHTAADDMCTVGRPKGTSVLPVGYIRALADLYRKSTGHQPRAGGGPFTKFVRAFLNAVGRSSIAAVTVIDAIKNARREYGWL